MSTTQNNTPGEAALLPAVLIEAAAGAADRALRTVFDTEVRTALEQALAQGEADQGGRRPPQGDADPPEPVTWMVRVRHEVRMAIQAALEAALSEPGETPKEDEPPPPRKPAHATLEAFVVGFLGPIIARKMPGAGRGFGWCPQWWRHAEAIGRLMALWEACSTCAGPTTTPAPPHPCNATRFPTTGGQPPSKPSIRVRARTTAAQTEINSGIIRSYDPVNKARSTRCPAVRPLTSSCGQRGQ